MVDGNPSWMIALLWSLDAPDQAQCAICILLVCPYTIRPHIRRVQIRFGWIEHHAVDGRRQRVFIVLDILGKSAAAVCSEDVSKASMVVEGVAVDIVRWFLSGEKKYGAGLRGSIICFGFLLSIAGTIRDLANVRSPPMG
jgi:hypothetical protein